MKAIVLCFKDVDPGATATLMTLRAEVVFIGTAAEFPDRVLTDRGPDGNGLPIAIDITALAQYPNVVEDALIARAVQLGLPAVTRTDCLFPTYQRGA